MPKYTAGEYGVIISANTKPAIDDLKKVKKEITGTKSSFGDLFKSMKLGWIGAAAAAGKAFQSIKQYITNSIKSAINYAETVQKFNVTFRDVRSEANKMARELRNSFGLSNQEAKELLSSTGDLLTGFGLTGKEALDLSSAVQKLAVDTASFSNIEGGAKRASEALTKALLGERESVKALGIVISEKAIQERLALKNQDKLTGNALLQAKAYATLEIATEQSKNAIGDFARSQDSAANILRTINARFHDIAVTVGDFFMPAVVSVLKPIKNLLDNNKGLINTTSRLAEIRNKLTTSTEGLHKETKTLLKAQQELLRIELVSDIEDINDSFSDLKNELRDVSDTISNYEEVLRNASDVMENEFTTEQINDKIYNLNEEIQRLNQLKIKFQYDQNKLRDIDNQLDKAIKKKGQLETMRAYTADGEAAEKIVNVSEKIKKAKEEQAKLEEEINKKVLETAQTINLDILKRTDLEKINWELRQKAYELLKKEAEIIKKTPQPPVTPLIPIEYEIKEPKQSDAKNMLANMQDMLDETEGLEVKLFGDPEALNTGKKIGSALLNSLQGNDGKAAAKGLGNDIGSALQEMGGWAALIGTIIQIFWGKTKDEAKKFIHDLIENIDLFTQQLIQTIASILFNPVEIARIFKQLIMGLFDTLRALFTGELFKDNFFGKQKVPVDLEMSKSAEINIEIVNAEEELEKLNKLFKNKEFLIKMPADDILKHIKAVNTANNILKEDTQKELWDLEQKLEAADNNKDNLLKKYTDDWNKYQTKIDEWKNQISKLENFQWSVRDDYMKLIENFQAKQQRLTNDYEKSLENIDQQIENIENTIDSLNATQSKGSDETKKYLDNIIEVQTTLLNHSHAINKNNRTDLEQTREKIKLFEYLLKNSYEFKIGLFEQWKLEEDIVKLKEKEVGLTLDQITETDELLKLKKEAGQSTLSDIEYNKQLIDILKEQLDKVIELANEKGLDVLSMEEYWDILIEINKLEYDSYELERAKNEEIQKQNDSLKSQYEMKLSAEEKLKQAQLIASGLSTRQVEKQMQAFRVEQFQERKILAGIDGTSLSEMGNLASIFSGLVGQSGGFRVSGELAKIGEFIKNYQPSNTITNIDIRSLAEGINTGKISRDEILTIIEDLKEEVGSI